MLGRLAVAPAGGEDEHGFGRWDAYLLVGQLAESAVANIVDPIYTVVAKFPKRYLPAG